jgi:hypothetical protein
MAQYYDTVLQLEGSLQTSAQTGGYAEGTALPETQICTRLIQSWLDPCASAGHAQGSTHVVGQDHA